MNFTSELNVILRDNEISEIKNSKTITNALVKHIVTEEDLIQFSQFRYLLELGQDNFVYEIFLGAKEENVLQKVEQVISKFDSNQISPQIYAYYLYATLQALSIKCDRVIWVDPFLNDLKDGHAGFNTTFGTGLYKESLEDYIITKNVLKGFNKEKKYMTIPYGVTEIDDMVLSGNNTVEYLTLPETLTKLPMGLAGNCTKLKKLIMPSTIKVITQNFCKGARNLNLVVASGATEIQENAFEDTAINNINFVGNNRIERIAEFAFKNCSNLKKIDLSNAKVINKFAFNNCKGITDISISLTKELIENNPTFYTIFEKELSDFKRYVELVNVTLHVPNGKIPARYFEGCSNLASIKIIGEVKEIGSKAFKGCTNLSTIDMAFTGTLIESEVFSSCIKLTNLSKFHKVTNIESGAFRECHALTKLEFNTINSLGERSFEDCTNLSNVDFNYTNKVLPEFVFSGCYSLKDYSFLNNVETIAAYSLAKNIFDENFKIPSSVKSIATNAFDSCAFDGKLIIPSDCKINICAFSNISKINFVEFDTLQLEDINKQKIEPFMIFESRLETFNNHLKTLTEIQVNDNNLNEGAFKGWTNITNVILYSDLNEIPKSCFQDCMSLRTVYVESEEFSIGDHAFANCISLKHLESTQSEVDSNNLHTVDLSLTTKLGQEVFKSCVNIERICVPIVESSSKNKFKLHSLFEEEIAAMSTGKYTNLHTIILMLSTGSVPNNLFEGCDKIRIIEVNGEVTELGEGFFKNCTNLVKIKMDYTGNVIPKECFKNCISLTELSPYASVVKIDNEAFMGCESLNKVEFASPIISLGVSAFESCEKLKQVKMNFVGEVLPANCFKSCLSIENFNFLQNIVKAESYSLANVIFPAGFSVPAKLDIIEKYAFANTTFLTTLSLPAAKHMDQLSFVNAKGFSKIEFRNLKMTDSKNNEIKPFTIFTDSLQDFNHKYSGIDTVFIRTNNVCEEAFKDWHFLRSAIFTPEVRAVPNSCFEGCVHLHAVKIPYADMEFGNNVFKNCNALDTVNFTDLTITNKKKSLVPMTMYNNCVNLTNVSIFLDESVIDNGMKFYSFFEEELEAFNTNYKKVTSVIIRTKIKTIPEEFFEGCENIEKIYVLDDINNLGHNAFASCVNLYELKMNYLGNIIPTECFYGCERLPNITNLTQVKIIEDRAFEKCFSLTAIQFRTPIELMGERVFSNCLNLEKINMYYIGEVLHDACFANCEGLLVTPIFLNVKEIKNSVFNACINLDHVYINAVPNMLFPQIFPSSKRITKISYTSTIVPDEYFKGISNVEEVDFTQKVTYIGEHAFSNINSLKTIKNLSYVETIGNYAFSNSGLEHIRISPKTMFMGAGIFAGCDRLREIEMPVRFMYAGVLFDDLNENSTKKIVQTNHGVFKEYCIPESLKTISINDGKLHPGVFSGMQVNISVEYSVKHIPDYAFYDCNEVVFESPKAIESIGEYALSYVAMREGIFINVSKVSDYAMYSSVFNVLEFGKNLKTISTRSLLDAKIGEFKLTSNPNFVFSNEMLVNLEKGLIVHTNNVSGEVTIPDAVTKLEEDTFIGCENITKINTNRVNTIKTGAFVNCSSLSSVVLDKNLVTCESGIFKNCNNINELSLSFLGKDRRTPKDINYLFQNFGEEVYMKSITISDGQLVNEPFKGCAVIENLDISKLQLKTLENNTFNNIIFTNLSLPDSLEKISENAFVNTTAVEVNSNSKNVKVFDECIYNGNHLVYCFVAKAHTITIPKDVTEIISSAFINTSSIESLTIENNSLKVNNAFDKVDTIDSIVVGDIPNNISVMFAEAYSKIRNVTYTGRVPRKGFFDDLCLFSELNLPNIEEMAVSYINPELSKQILIETLNVGANLKNLDPRVFGFIDIANINFTGNKRYKTYNNILVDTNESAIIFAANNIDSNVVIDFDAKEIKPNVFEGNDNLVSIDTGNVKIIGDEAFKSCNALSEVKISNNCNSIGKSILKYCNKIKNLTVPFVGENIQNTTNFNYLFDTPHPELIIHMVNITNQKIINSTFEDCKCVYKVILSEGTKEMKSNSFVGAMNLREIYIPKSLTTVGESIFFKCKKKLNVYVENKNQVEAWSKDWRKTKTVHLFNNIKIISANDRMR